MKQKYEALDGLQNEQQEKASFEIKQERSDITIEPYINLTKKTHC